MVVFDAGLLAGKYLQVWVPNAQYFLADEDCVHYIMRYKRHEA
jgi:hypothetical protein